MQTVRVNVIDALAVDPLTIDAQILRYPKLAKWVASMEPFIKDAHKHLQSDVPDTFTAHCLKREIENYELLRTALAMQNAEDKMSERMLATQFTKLSKKLFGEPDPAVTSHLANEALIGFRSWRGQVSDRDLQLVEEAYEQLLRNHGSVDPIRAEAEATSIALNAELHGRYERVFALLENGQSLFTASQAADIFEQILVILARDEPAWADWTINRRADTTIFSVSATQKQINVGLRRQPMTLTDCKGVIAHEVIVHAQRAINGAKVDYFLGHGMPGYVAAEEGLAILMEFAVSGKLPYKIFDRYIDVALALRGISRPELLKVALARARLRAQRFGSSVTDDELTTITWAQTNRIYRGTKGEEVVGVFTKDICYYKGLALIVEYIVHEQAKGASIGALLDFLLLAKFDPTDKLHLDHMVQLGLPVAPSYASV